MMELIDKTQVAIAQDAAPLEAIASFEETTASKAAAAAAILETVFTDFIELTPYP